MNVRPRRTGKPACSDRQAGVHSAEANPVAPTASVTYDPAARRIAREVGIDEVIADVLPAQKADKVKARRDHGGSRTE